MSIVETALEVAARGLPVFPTIDKKPCWSNDELKVPKGQGGYKIATTDPDRVRELFSHRRAKEIAVPMGEMSGLLCIDVDLHKADPGLPEGRKVAELEDALLECGTLVHRTRSGGLHFIFRHDPGIKWPATLMEHVDVKASGNGYICWPGTPGYEVINAAEPQAFPIAILQAAMRAKGGTGNVTALSSWNDKSNAELAREIETAQQLYPALRSLSFRLATETMNGHPMSPEQQTALLRQIMDASEAASPGHPRHDDWQDRYGKIEELVASANRKQKDPLSGWSQAEIDAMQQGEAFIDTQEVLAAAARKSMDHVRTPTEADIKAEEITPNDGEFEDIDPAALPDERLDPPGWLIEQAFTIPGVCSVAGPSNIGKTRFMATLAMLGATGDLDLIGLPETGPFSTLWVANEEHAVDIKRRCKAAQLFYGTAGSGEIVRVRGKARGSLRLVGKVQDRLEIDKKAVAKLVREIEDCGAKLLILDPFITLSTGMEENSADDTDLLYEAFNLIANLTGCCVVHVHHSGKTESKTGQNLDWLRGSSEAWRGSSAIYSSLDCGWTLANWMPREAEQRKKWKEQLQEHRLDRWIVFDPGKIREGRGLLPLVFELVPFNMPEGYEIGVCRKASKEEALNVIAANEGDALWATRLGEAMVQHLGEGRHTIAQVHKAMKAEEPDIWTSASRLQQRDPLWSQLEQNFSSGVIAAGHRVSWHVIRGGRNQDKFGLLIETLEVEQ